MLEDAGRTLNDHYSRTPLDFIRKQDWSFSLSWSHGVSFLEKLRLTRPDHEKPIDHFKNTTVMPIPAHTVFAGVIFSLIYFGILATAWNHSFPTKVELWLWRSTTLYCIIIAPSFFFYQEFGYSLYPYVRRRLNHNDSNSSRREDMSSHVESRSKEEELEAIGEQASTRAKVKRALHNIAESIRNNSFDKDPNLRAPLKALLPSYIFGTLYGLARLCAWIQDLVELRSLEASAFQNVSWSWVLVHIQ